MYSHLINLQKRLAEKVIICPYENDIKLIGGVDVSFEKYSNVGYCAFVVLNNNCKIVEVKFHTMEINIPYIPGLLSFRELPLVYNTIKKLDSIPDIILCDSQGIAHPRGLGFASHLGVALNKPTIGCAKSKLIGNFDMPNNDKGSFSFLEYKNEKIGTVLRTKYNCKPLFISPGHLTDIASSVRIVLQFTGRYKMPEPTRLAHIYSNKLRRGDI